MPGTYVRRDDAMQLVQDAHEAVAKRAHKLRLNEDVLPDHGLTVFPPSKKEEEEEEAAASTAGVCVCSCSRARVRL